MCSVMLQPNTYLNDSFWLSFLQHKEKTVGWPGSRRAVSLLTGWKARVLTPRWPTHCGDSETWWWKTRSTSDRRTTFKCLCFTPNSQDSNLCKTFLLPNLSYHDSRCDKVLCTVRNASAIIISPSCVHMCVCVYVCVKNKGFSHLFRYVWRTGMKSLMKQFITTEMDLKCVALTVTLD